MGMIYQRWAKFITVFLIVLSSVACILFGTALLSVLGNGVSLSEVQEERDYADTDRASREAEYYLRALESFVGNSRIFGEGGGYNPLKTIDITNWKAAEEEQNENTTYTMEQLLAMLSNYQYTEIERGLDTIEYNDYYGYEASYDVQLDGYTSEFKYLYSEVRPYEVELPSPELVWQSMPAGMEEQCISAGTVRQADGHSGSGAQLYEQYAQISSGRAMCAIYGKYRHGGDPDKCGRMDSVD